MTLIDQGKYYTNYGLSTTDFSADSGFQSGVKDIVYENIPMFNMRNVPISYQPCNITFTGSVIEVEPGDTRPGVNVSIAKDEYDAYPIILSRYINTSNTSNKYGLIEMELEIESLFNFTNGSRDMQYSVTSHLKVSLVKTYSDRSDSKTYKYSINEIKQSNNCQLRHYLENDVQKDPPFQLQIDAMNYRVEENEDKIYIILTYPKNADYMMQFNQYSHSYNILQARANVLYNSDLQYHFFNQQAEEGGPVMNLAMTGFLLEIEHEVCNGTIKYIDYRRNI